MKNLLAAQEFFKDDRFQKLVGVNIEEVGDGYAVCGVNLDENHFNADGIVQGGVIYTLADSAFAVAANSGEFFTVTLSSSESSREVKDYFELRESAYAEARKGFNIQRYKGLGEMNPEQLEMTTMNPEKRALLQVSIEDAQAASDTIEELMGDRADLRRDFIIRNALSMEDLDI